MNLADIRDGFRDALGGIPGISVVYRTVGSVNPPAVILGSPSGTYDAAFGRVNHDITWPLVLVVANAADGAIEDLDRYLADDGDFSIRDAIDSHETDAWDDARVIGFEQYGVIEVGGVSYVGCIFNVSVLL